MVYDLRFVDSIAASPTVRLDLNAAPWTARVGTEFGMPELKRSVVSTLLRDGDTYPAAAYGNRTLSLLLRVDAATDDAAATQLQLLYRELDRPSNILLYRPGTTAPVFFRTFRCGPDAVTWDPFTKEVRVQVPAEPFALGLKESLPAVTVWNDPAEGTTLNADPFFETEGASAGGSNPGFETGTTSAWTAAAGTIAASQDFVEFDSWAGKLTASGAANPRVTHSQSATFVTAGVDYTLSGWLYAPVALPSTATITIQWYTAAGVFVSQNVLSTTLTASVWTFLEGSFTAPPTAERAARQFAMGGTPAAGVLLYGDEIQVRVAKPVNWTGVGGRIVRSEAQAHEGVASMLLTPDGVTASVEARSELVAVTAGQQYRVSAWVRCAAARNVNVSINWHDSGGVYLSTAAASSVAVAATTWTLIDGTYTAPVGAAQALLVVSMGSTPSASHLLYIDEARIRPAGGAGGMCLDVSAPKGDVEAPLYLQIPTADVVVSGRRTSAIAVRRRGTPSGMPSVLQAEAMTVGTDTTVQANSSVMSGAGSNYMRTSFATDTAMTTRLITLTTFPTAASTDVRGTYRMFARVRKTVGADVITMRLLASLGSATITGDVVTVPSGTDIRWVDLGLLSYPIGFDPITDGLSGVPVPVGGVALFLAAARSSGSGSLDIDCLMAVPADDRYCEVLWPNDSGPTSFVVDSAGNGAYGIGTTGELQPTAIIQFEGLPPMVTPGQACRLVWLLDVGTTSSGGDVLTETVQVTPYYWPRYLMVRPVSS